MVVLHTLELWVWGRGCTFFQLLYIKKRQHSVTLSWHASAKQKPDTRIFLWTHTYYITLWICSCLNMISKMWHCLCLFWIITGKCESTETLNSVDIIDIPQWHHSLLLYQGKPLFSTEVQVNTNPKNINTNTKKINRRKRLDFDSILAKSQKCIQMCFSQGLNTGHLPGNDKWFHSQTFAHSPAPNIQTSRLQILGKSVWFEIIPEV